MTNNRDDFSLKVKETLGKRTGWKCSNPHCGCPTTGPHTQSDKSISIGVAAHICAAAPGGPRYDKNMSSADRSSAKNGIWLCQSCSKLIDTDESHFTVSLLHEWKRSAEELAFNEIRAKSKASSAPQSAEIPVNDQNEIISQTRVLMEYANEFYTDYQGYAVGRHEEDDVAIYERCVQMVYALSRLLSLEATYHKQLHKLQADEHIFKLRKHMPDFHDAAGDITGATMIYTIHNYIDFFTSKSSVNFSKTCKKIINLIDEI